MADILLGIDLGTSACKVGAFSLDGRMLAQASAAYPTAYPQPGWSEQAPEVWWQAACRALQELMAQGATPARDVLGIAVSGQSWAMVMVDSAGQALLPSPIWTDSRAQAQCEAILRLIPEEELFALSGNPLQPGYTFPKILWCKQHHPRVYQACAAILQSNSFIAFRLTGQFSQDRSQGYGLCCYDISAGQWDEEVCARLGVDPGLLPPLFDSHGQVGLVTREAAGQAGLMAGIPVFAGGLDAACSALGVGVIAPGQVQEQGGQAGGMSICTASPFMDRRLILSTHVVPGRWLLQGGTTGGGGALKWCRETFCPGLDFQQMDSLAAGVPPGCDGLTFLPYLAGERSPLWEPGAQGVFYGLRYASGRAHMIRAVMEGVAFSLRHNLETARATGTGISLLRATGGAARSALWTQMKADVTGIPLELPSSEESTALGAALLAGVGAGAYRGFAQAVARAVRPGRRLEPGEGSQAAYNKAYARYRELADRLLPMMAQRGGQP
ncbi:MAG: xylulokinase [Clostridiales bacterium]|nr:xylulokinase [Clostridiales bacterium]